MDTVLARVAGSDELAHAFFWAAQGQATPGLPLARRFMHFVQALLALSGRDSFLLDATFTETLTRIAGDDQRRTALQSLLAPFQVNTH